MDVDNLYGAYEFIEARQAQKTHPLGRFRNWTRGRQCNNFVSMIALSTKGYQNLMKMSTVKMMGKSNWEDVEAI